MSVESVTWVAHRVESSECEDARRFASALGFEVLSDEPDKVMLRTVRGDVVEYCGPDAAVPEYLFANQDTVVGYQVADVERAASDLLTAGFTALADRVETPEVTFQHFVGPGGRVVGVIRAG